jgi:carboxypeptidase Q
MSLRHLVLALAVPGSLAAQTTDPVAERIFRIGMDSSQVEPLAQVLLDSIGPRLTGTPGMSSASDWVMNKYREWGIEARRHEYGTWRGWRRGVSRIELVEPRVRSLEGQMLAWSPGTAQAVTAEAVVLPTFADSTEFVRWLPQARGKIVLLSPAYPTCRPSEDWIQWATPESRARMDTLVAQTLRDWSVVNGANGRPDSSKMYRGTGYTLSLGTGTLGRRLEEAGVAGMVSSRAKLRFADPLARQGPGVAGGGRGFGGGAGGPGSMRGGGPAANRQARGGGFGFDSERGSGGWGVIEVFETYNTTAPAVTLTCEDYGLLYRLAENGQRPMVRLDLDAELLGEVPAFNTIGTIKGSEKPDEYVILSAHFDSWDGSSGATDNGTGTIMAMEAMRILKTAYANPKRTIVVGHWAAEENGLIGSRAYAEDHPEVMRGLQALFNQDNGTGRVQSISAAGLTAIGPHLKKWYDALPSFYTDSLSDNVVAWSFADRPTGNPGGTDGAVFACYATPSFGMGALGWNYGTYTWHTNRDTYDKVVFDDLKHNATLAALLAYQASEDPQFIARDKSPGEWPANWPENCGKAPRTTRPRL